VRGMTVEDVAFAQLLMRLHELQEDPLVVGGIEGAKGTDRQLIP